MEIIDKIKWDHVSESFFMDTGHPWIFKVVTYMSPRNTYQSPPSSICPISQPCRKCGVETPIEMTGNKSTTPPKTNITPENGWLEY